MPTYQYACTECGHNFDIVQSFTDDSLTVCPECEGRLRKVFNAVGVVFKGSGFYRTDSRGTSTDSTPSTGSDSSGSSGSKSDSSTSSTSDTAKSTPTKDSTKPSTPAPSTS